MDYKISTMTINGNYNMTFNLLDIGKYLEIDDVIIGIKYKYADKEILRGSYETTKYKLSKVKKYKYINKISFNNQISFVIKQNQKSINAKLFSNGSLQLTGVKDKQDVSKIMKLLHDKLIKLNNKQSKILLSTDDNGVLLDSDNMIYSYNHKIIGYYLDNKYFINQKPYSIDKFTNCFIADKLGKKKTRELIDFNGIQVGYTQIQLLRGQNNLYKKNINIFYDTDICYENEIPYTLIFHRDFILGKTMYFIDKPITQIKTNIIQEFLYTCNHINQSYVEDININCINLNCNLEYELNRNRLYKLLCNDNFSCTLQADFYPGLKFIYKKPIDSIGDGKCYCKLKCTCDRVIFSIFKSGNVNVFGLKDTDTIIPILTYFKTIMDPYTDVIKRRIF